MRNGRIKNAFFWCCLGGCTGCAVSQPQQIFPDEWNYIDRIDDLDPAGMKAMLRRPRNLDESLERTHKLNRQFTRAAARADQVPQTAGAVLSGLGAFGGYRAVVHPSAQTAAALLGTGGAIYTLGSGVNWPKRSAAYMTAVEGLECLLAAALPYDINGRDGAQTGQQQLQAAHDPLQQSLLQLELAIVAHAALNTTYKIAEARSLPSSCIDAAWDKSVCEPVSGTDSARYERDCRNTAQRHQRMCAPAHTAATYSVPAPEVTSAFTQASLARTKARRALDASSRMQAAANAAGTRLWTDSLGVMRRAFANVRDTGFDLPELLRQLGAALQGAKQGPVAGMAHGREVQPDASTESAPAAAARHKARQADGGTVTAMHVLDAATVKVLGALGPLQNVLDANAIYPAFSTAPFDACVPDDTKALQTVVRAAIAPPAEDTTLVKITPELSTRLKLPENPSGAEIESRIRLCQQALNIGQDAKLTPAMAGRIMAGQCEAVP